MRGRATAFSASSSASRRASTSRRRLSGVAVRRSLLLYSEGALTIQRAVSNGHGMSADGVPFTYGAVKDTWHTFVSAWLNETYGSQSFLNGAMAATDSSFLRYCWPERVRLEEQAPDLVFVELDVNDIACVLAHLQILRSTVLTPTFCPQRRHCASRSRVARPLHSPAPEQARGASPSHLEALRDAETLAHRSSSSAPLRSSRSRAKTGS